MAISAETNQVKPARWGVVGGWLLLFLGLAAVYGHTFWEMWIRWFPAWRHTREGLYQRLVGGESYYTHGPLVPLLSLFIAFLLVRHTKIPVRPSRILGAVVLLGSLFVHLAACLARVNFVSGFTIIGTLAGLILLFWGTTALRRLWFPLALLLFMVPLPEVSIAQLNFRLKMWAADWGVQMANLLGVIVERSGNRVYLEGDKTLVIANVCNGLRTLISLLAFGALYAYVCRLRGAWRLFLFSMSVPVAVVSNSIRIVSLIVVADIWDAQVATGWYHDTSGVLIYFVAFGLMFGLERVILWARKLAGRPAAPAPLLKGEPRGEEDRDQVARMWRAAGGGAGWAVIVVMGLAAGGTWWLNRTIPSRWDGGMARQALPADMEVGGRQWHGYDMELDENTLTILETRDYFFRRYVSPSSEPVDFCVIFSQDNRKGTHPPDLCLEGSGDGIMAKADVVVPGVEGRGGVPCRELIVQAGREKLYFLYTYKCGGRYTRSFWGQQYTIFVNGLLSRNSSGALIRVSTRVGADGNLAEAKRQAMLFMGSAIPCLDRSLP